MKIFNRIRNYFHTKYVALFELLTLKVMLVVNRMVRKLIILKGKDPDYVAALPPPMPPVPTKADEEWAKLEKAAQNLNKFYSSARTSLNNESWVKTPGSHPVLKSRVMFEKKLQAPQVEETALEDMAACLSPKDE